MFRQAVPLQEFGDTILVSYIVLESKMVSPKFLIISIDAVFFGRNLQWQDHKKVSALYCVRIYSTVEKEGKKAVYLYKRSLVPIFQFGIFQPFSLGHPGLGFVIIGDFYL